MSATLSLVIIWLMDRFVHPDVTGGIGDNFSGMIGSTLALVGMSVAGSVFLIEFLESNAEKDSRYDTISDRFREDMEKCMAWIVVIAAIQIALLSIFLMMDLEDESNMSGNRTIIVYLSTWLFCWNCCTILQFDYDLVTVKKRMRSRSEKELLDFCSELKNVRQEVLEDGNHDDSEGGDQEKDTVNAHRKNASGHSLFAWFRNGSPNPRSKAIEDSLKRIKSKMNIDNLWKNAGKKIVVSKDGGEDELSDPFKLFYTMESVMECIVDLPKGTAISSMHKFKAMNQTKDSKSGNVSEGEALYYDYICFRELRDYAVVSEMDSLVKSEDSGSESGDSKNSNDKTKQEISHCMMFCSLILQYWISQSLKNKIIRGVTFHSEDFSNAKMDSSVFSDSVFTNVSFRNANAGNSSFIGCRLSHIDFKGSTMADASFTDVYATTMDLSGAYCLGIKTAGTIRHLDTDLYTSLDGWTAEGLDLSYATIDGSSMKYTDFKRCRVTDMDMEHTINVSSSFDDVMFIRGNYRDFDASSSRFTKVYLDSVDLYDADLSACSFSDIRLNKAYIREVKLNRGYISELSLAGSCVEGMSMSGVIRDSRVYDVEITGMTVSNQEFKDCSFDNVRINGGPKGSSFSWSVFSGGRISNSIIENSFIENVQFFDVRFSNVDFSSCELTEVSFHGCVFVNCNIRNGSKVIGLNYDDTCVGELAMRVGL